MPESAIMSIVGVETSPARTAVSPKTSAPTTDSAMPTYLGMRMLASFKISKMSRTTSISSEGEKGMLSIDPATLNKNLSGISSN